MLFSNRKSKITFPACLLLAIALLIGGIFADSLTVYATQEELEAEAEARKSLPIQSNEIDNWPVGPEISAQAAILMDADTGAILYAKNIDEKLYPASTTKMMTCVLAMEEGNLDDMVEFTTEAVFSVPSDGSNMGMDVGESITMEECLYGILVGSANEVANAVAEHIGGTIDNFVTMMNERAAELGCTNTHFVNTNGLYDDDHYTTAYDLALIARAFFQDEMLCKIGNTARYHFEATATQPDDFYLNNKHKLINGEIEYDGICGGKTGYTNEARQTLVTCAEQNGMKLICVVLKEESPTQFTDTVELFDYGFHNFQIMNISENEEDYNIEATGFLQIGNDIFGNSKSILSLDTDSYVIIPNTINFNDLESEIDYSVSEENENRVAQIMYSYHDTFVGKAYLNLIDNTASSYDFDTNITTTDINVEKTEAEPEQNTIFINVKKVLIGILILAAVIILLFVLQALVINNKNAKRRKNRVKRKQNRRARIRSDFDDFDF
ncbi:MAG: D-alanyl-D-alanine carboxypeptidase [Clostridiales bacterium]|nr:D-alanyl-D-alanine carboxypeptidase [Clostridiales bacterium]